MNSVRSSVLSLKYQRLTPSSCQDIRIRQFEFVVKTQFFDQILLKIAFNYNNEYFVMSIKK